MNNSLYGLKYMDLYIFVQQQIQDFHVLLEYRVKSDHTSSLICNSQEAELQKVTVIMNLSVLR